MYIIAVRLVEGQTGMEGLVQVYYNNTWGWVGADRWDKQDGDVVCRMLGISGSTSLLHASNSGNYTILMNNVQCTGQESSLFSCVYDVWGSHLGANSHKAGVVCKGQGGKGWCSGLFVALYCINLQVYSLLYSHVTRTGVYQLESAGTLLAWIRILPLDLCPSHIKTAKIYLTIMSAYMRPVSKSYPF